MVRSSTLVEQPIGQDLAVREIGEASDDARFAAAVAAFGQKLKGSNYGEMRWDEIPALASGARGSDENGHRAEFVGAGRSARQRSIPSRSARRRKATATAADIVAQMLRARPQPGGAAPALLCSGWGRAALRLTRVGAGLRERLIDGAMVALAALLGLAFCWLWAGPAVLDPMSSGWLQSGDRAMHTLGWWFFREAPWGAPPGASPLLGLELSSSVALSDSLPLFAFPFKLMAGVAAGAVPVLGAVVCAQLRAAGRVRLPDRARAGAGRWVALLAALFCLIQPAFLNRIGGHMALGGHWTILVGLYLYLRRVPPQVMGVAAAAGGGERHPRISARDVFRAVARGAGAALVAEADEPAAAGAGSACLRRAASRWCCGGRGR